LGKLNFDVLEYSLTTNLRITIQIVNDELCNLKCKLENWRRKCLKGIIFITAGERSVAGGCNQPTVQLPDRQDF
jgi:hypothetical protein